MLDDYSFEEKDDPRTSTGELIPDCERDLRAIEEESLMTYYQLFHDLLDACREVEKAKKLNNQLNGKNRGYVICANKKMRQQIKRNYEHARIKAKEALRKLKEFNYRNVAFPWPDRDLLNALTINAKRRSSYYETIRDGRKRARYFSYEDFEEWYRKKRG